MQYLKIQNEIEYSQKRYALKREIEDMFVKEGYSNIEPCAFESLYSFISLSEKIKKESMVKVLNGGSDVLVLRHDNTTNIIKNLVPRWQDKLNLKLFYNSTVYRSNIDSDIKEIRQIGIEHLGDSSIGADKEVLRLSLNILKKYNDGFILEISNSKYLEGLFSDLNIENNKKEHLKDLIYKKNSSELEAYVKNLNIKNDISDCLSSFLSLQGDIKDIAKKAKKLYMNGAMEGAINELLDLQDFIDEAGFINSICYDLSLVTELNYYDGIVFKGFYPNSFKDIINGGRYDNFTMDFGKRVPAIGFSVDLDELAQCASQV